MELHDKAAKPRRMRLEEERNAFAARVAGRIIPKLKRRYKESIAKDWQKTQNLFADKSVTTKKLYGSLFRKSVSDAILAQEPDAQRVQKLNLLMKELLHTDPDVLEEVNDAYRQKIVENTRSLIFVQNYQQMVATAEHWLEGDQDENRALGLMLLTGRRFYEVLVAGEFSRSEIDGKAGKIIPTYRMNFKGQLKTRGAKDSKFQTLYHVPTLAPVAKILTALERLRHSDLGQDVMAQGQDYANSYHNPRFNKILRYSEIGQLWPKKTALTVKLLRTLYAEICYKYHAPAHQHKDAYFAEILGHSERDLTTALSYVRFYLDQKDGDHARHELDRLIKAKLRQDRGD